MIVERLLDENVVRGEVSGDVVESTGLDNEKYIARARSWRAWWACRLFVLAGLGFRAKRV